MPWIKLWSEMLSDPKIKHLSAVEKWIWVGLLLLANEGRPRGTIHVCESMPYDLSVLASMLDLYGDEVDWLKSALDKMERMDMVRIDEQGFITITHFEERQYIYYSDTPKEINKRVKKHRKKQEQESNDNETTEKRGGNAIDVDVEEDIDNILPIDLLSRYEAHIGYRFRAPGGWPSKKELRAAKDLLALGYIPAQVCACHDWLSAQDWWKDKQISLQSILNKIDFYVKKHPQTTKDVLDKIEDL